MATNKVRLRSLLGADRDFNIELLGTPTSTAPYGFPDYSVSRGSLDPAHTTTKGAKRKKKKKQPRRITFNNVIISRANKDKVNQLKESRTEIAVEPPWADGTTPLTYLPLQKTLSDLREQDTRTDIDFERYSSRFNSVTGRKTLFRDPHYEDAPFGSGIHISDVINDTHAPSYELRSYLTQDAEDVGATTRVYVSPAQAVLWNAYNATALLTISNEEEATNAHEIGLISAINTTTGLVTLTGTAGGAALAGTANYTYAKRTHISSVLVSDCEFEDSGLGSWADMTAPILKEKNDTQRETGTNCLRTIGSAANSGAQQVLGEVPAGTDLAIWVRAKVIMGTGASALKIQIYNNSDVATELSETVASTETTWAWYRYCVEIARGGAGQKEIELRLISSIAATDEFLVDRVYIWQDSADNGGMEGVYVNQGAGAPGVAPGWTAINVEVGDNVAESADEHGGDKAQQIDVTAAGEGVRTGTAMTNGKWYLIGGYFKVASGNARIRDHTAGVNLISGIDDTPYTFRSAIYLAPGNNQIQVSAAGGAADFLFDDFMSIRLPGNPYDDGYYDLSEQLSTTAFTMELLYEPEVANTALSVDAYIFDISRRTLDGNNLASLHYDKVNNRFEFFVISGGVVKGVSLAKTFSAGDSVRITLKCTDGVDMELFVGVGSAAETSNTTTDAAIDIPAGLTRMWLGQNGGNYIYMARGSVACLNIEQTALSDTLIGDWFDLMDGTDASRLALLEETHGVIWEVESTQWAILTPSEDDKFIGSLTLSEIDRVGALETQDA